MSYRGLDATVSGADQFPKNKMTTLSANVEVERGTGEIWPQIGY